MVQRVETQPLSGQMRDRGDPLAAVLAFGSSAVRTGLLIGFGIATISHGAFGARVLATPIEMLHWAMSARAQIHDHLWTQYDVEVAKAEPKPEPPRPEPKPEPEQQAATVIKEAPRPAENTPPPAAAQAGKLITAPSDPNEPVDLTGQGWAQGNAETYTGGSTAAAGTATTAVYSPHATVGGTPGGTGTGAPPPPPKPTQGPDQSRPPGVAGGTNWSCPFPAEADTDQVDYAVVKIVVTVREDGTPLNVRVLNDPGHGFGRAARMCALGQRYMAALDRDGKPTVATTPPINVSFTR